MNVRLSIVVFLFSVGGLRAGSSAPSGSHSGVGSNSKPRLCSKEWLEQMGHDRKVSESTAKELRARCDHLENEAEFFRYVFHKASLVFDEEVSKIKINPVSYTEVSSISGSPCGEWVEWYMRVRNPYLSGAEFSDLVKQCQIIEKMWLSRSKPKL